MKKCRNYANAIRLLYSIFAWIIVIALIIISDRLENWRYFVVGCSVYALWFVLVFAYASHLDAVADQLEQNDKIIALLSAKVKSAPAAFATDETGETDESGCIQSQEEPTVCSH